MGTAADQERTVIERYDPLVGTILDERFRIDFQLAAGGFGAIYRATDVRADAQVALKVLHPKLAGDSNVAARFRREGATLASLRDPHTITAYELGEARDGTLYIVMELLHGVSLYERLRAQGPMPWRRVLHIARGVCSSLAEAHAQGIVHRDLKPANIHLESRGNDAEFAKVLDFGIAKIVQGSGFEPTELTQAGQMIGTVDYMSPEQMVGGEMTPRSDIYSLGVLLYEMLSRRTPFAEAKTPTAVLAAVLTQTPALVSTYADVPPALDEIVARCLEREPAHRFAEVSEVIEAIDAVVVAGEAQPAAWAASTEEPSEDLSEVPTEPVFSGFEPDSVLTTDATRIDVRVTDSSEPVLDARGPRMRPGAILRTPLISPASLPPPFRGRAIQARGSQHGADGSVARHSLLEGRGGLESRGSQPLLDGAGGGLPHGAGPPAYAPGGPAPYGYFQPYAETTPADRASYLRHAALQREVMLRRILWWMVLFLISTAITLLATR
jgi:serine/threonine-protein kinase